VLASDCLEGCSPGLRGVFSPLIDLHTNIHQHLWNLLVITPTTNVEACLSGVYAGIDGLSVVLKRRQQHPTHLAFARPRVKEKGLMWSTTSYGKDQHVRYSKPYLSL
jgi:hypothetical protein